MFIEIHKILSKGANPGFHEAVGDTIALSVATPKHLHRVGLLEKTAEDFESLINYQFEMGVQKLAFLPFAYVMDTFRYDVFRGNVQAENANCHFWRLREVKLLKPLISYPPKKFLHYSCSPNNFFKSHL